MRKRGPDNSLMQKRDFKPKEKPHTVYTNDRGEKVPSVTTAIGVIGAQSLIYWANKIGREGVSYWAFMKSAAAVGTLAHSLIEKEVKGECEDIEEKMAACNDAEKAKAMKAFSNFCRWAEKNDFQMLGSEMKLVSNKYNYGGTVDFFGILNGRKVIIDFKTSGSFQKKMFMQLGAYRQLLIENEVIDEIEEVLVLRLDKETDDYYEMSMASKDLDEYFKLFKFALATYVLNERTDEHWKMMEQPF